MTYLSYAPESSRPQAVVDCQCANDQQPAGHQHITQQENPGDRLAGEVEQQEPDQVQPRRPPLIGRNGWHHIRKSLPEQLVDRNDLQALGPDPLNDQW